MTMVVTVHLLDRGRQQLTGTIEQVSQDARRIEAILRSVADAIVIADLDGAWST